MENFIQWLLNNYVEFISILLVIYEFLARQIPTIKSWSILNWIIKLFQWLVPNRQKTGGVFKMTNLENSKR